MHFLLNFDILSNFGNKFSNLFVFVYILTRLSAFRRLVSKERLMLKDKLLLALIFGFFGIIGSYFSIEYNGALINTRIIGVASGGLLGGPLVGLLAGVVAGIHRNFMDAGTVTSTVCAASTVIEGLLAGYMNYFIQSRKRKWPIAMLTGALCEVIRKIALLLFIKPFAEAWNIVSNIGMAMIIINSFGIALFFVILESTFKEHEKLAAEQASLSLKIADLTLPHLKNGLSSEGASSVVQIIYDMTEFDAVTLTDREKILAHVGFGTHRHDVGAPVLTNLTEHVLVTGEPKIVDDCHEACDERKNCRLHSALALPIIDGDKVIGTIKLYKSAENAMTQIDLELGEGLSKLISTEMRIANLEQQSKLLKEAEIKMLQAQINPHFLFNTLTVIASVTRTNPSKARELILSLSDFFRKNLSINRKSVSILDEIEHVKSYVTIEKARLKDDLSVEYKIDPSLGVELPPLTLQPLVENAIKHGIYPKNEPGKVLITAQKSKGQVLLSVCDNGVGMTEDQLNHLQTVIENSRALSEEKMDSYGFSNVVERLKRYFGEGVTVELASQLSIGTELKINIKVGEDFGHV